LDADTAGFVFLFADKHRAIISAGHPNTQTIRCKSTTYNAIFKQLGTQEKLYKAIGLLEKAGEPAKLIAAMEKVRASVDALETMVPSDLWPLPSYSDMLFIN
jgi:glutamine synthetase type III